MSEVITSHCVVPNFTLSWALHLSLCLDKIKILKERYFGRLKRLQSIVRVRLEGEVEEDKRTSKTEKIGRRHERTAGVRNDKGRNNGC